MRNLFSLFLVAFVLLLFSPCSSHADKTYTIRKGDSLYKIAKKFEVDLEKIKEANGIDKGRLKPGMKITIPSTETVARKSSASSKKLASGAAADSGRREHAEGLKHDAQYHTVNKGDTFLSISKKYAISVAELKELNSIRKTKRLKPGRQLVVKRTGPKTYTVKKGDTILKIAKKFTIDAEDLMFLNDLESEELKPGQKLVLEERAVPSVTKEYAAILSEKKIHEDIKTLSESTELSSMGLNDRLILFAKKMLNIPYRFGGSTFVGIDCSAYVQKVYSFLNIPLPRTAREQFTVGEPVKREDLSIGDLVFFRTYASFPSHVGIYLGNDLFIHASSRGKKVTIDSLETPYYFKRFIGAKRMITGESDELRDPKEMKKEG